MLDSYSTEPYSRFNIPKLASHVNQFITILRYFDWYKAEENYILLICLAHMFQMMLVSVILNPIYVVLDTLVRILMAHTNVVSTST